MKKLLLLLSLLLTSCSSLDYLTKDVKPVSSDQYVLFEKEVTYSVKRGIGYTWKEGLQKGLYRPESENQYGTFYRGPPACVSQYLEETSMGPFDGGIWIPKDRINYRPMIYYYFNYNAEKASKAGGVVVRSLLEFSKGDITFPPQVSEKTFLDDVVVTNIPIEARTP